LVSLNQYQRKDIPLKLVRKGNTIFEKQSVYSSGRIERDRLEKRLVAQNRQAGSIFVCHCQPERRGGLVYGVNDDATMFSVTKADANIIIKKLGNIALNNLSQSMQIQHDTIEYEGNTLLFFYIPEQTEKPFY
jgi:hypothetical protein